jgi:hypothetical protein
VISEYDSGIRITALQLALQGNNEMPTPMVLDRAEVFLAFLTAADKTDIPPVAQQTGKVA